MGSGISIEYISGLFDGEGSVLIKGSKDSMISPQVRIAGAYIQTLKDIKEFFGGNVYSVSIAKKVGNKNTYAWTMTSYDGCLCVLEAMLPHLREKKPQAEVAIEAINFAKTLPNRNRSESQKETLRFFKEKLKELKHYGCEIKK